MTGSIVFKIDRRSKLPLHTQIVSTVVDFILYNRTRFETSTLPLIEQLSEELNISTNIIEKAYNKLLSNHWIYKKGNQYYLRKFIMDADFFIFSKSLPDSIICNNQVPSIEIVEHEMNAFTNGKFEVLGVKDFIGEYKRIVLYGDSDPVLILDNYFTKKYRNVTFPIKDFKEAVLSVKRRIIDIVHADETMAKLLNIPPKTSIFRVIADTFDQYGDLVQCSESFIHPTTIINHYKK
jgi:DNA-binding GntR family transcriptional regulator